jgi:hypothetical protein
MTVKEEMNSWTGDLWLNVWSLIGSRASDTLTYLKQPMLNS